MFQIRLCVSQGVCFPYHILGTGRLSIAPFTDPWVWLDAESDPYALFARKYGVTETGIADVEEDWYDWVSKTISRCPESAAESLQYCSESLRQLAEGALPIFLAQWDDIHEELEQLLDRAVSDADLAGILQKNEHLFGLTYPSEGQEIFYFNHFPTLAAQRPGPHFVLGLGSLHRIAHLLETIAHEASLTLLEQFLHDDGIRPFLERVERVTREDRYAQGGASLIEALGFTVRALDRHREATTLAHIPSKPGETGFRQITEILFLQREVYWQSGARALLLSALRKLPVV